MMQQPIGFNESIRRSVETLGLGDNRRGPSSQVELTFSAKFVLLLKNFTNKKFPENWLIVTLLLSLILFLLFIDFQL